MTTLNRIDVLEDGTLQIRFKKEDGGWHRTTILPITDADTQIKVVNADLKTMKCGEVHDNDIAKIKAIVTKEQTPEKIVRYKESIKKRV